MNFLEMFEKIASKLKNKAVVPTVVLGLSFLVGVVFSPYFVDYQKYITPAISFSKLNYTVQDINFTDTLRQSEKVETDLGDIKQVDIIHLSTVCVDPDFIEFRNTQKPYRYRVKSEVACSWIIEQSQKGLR